MARRNISKGEAGYAKAATITCKIKGKIRYFVFDENNFFAMEDTEAKQNLIGEGGRYPRGRKSARAIDIADGGNSRGAEASQLLAGL